VFGDSGYQLDFIEAKKLRVPLSGREFAIQELDDWLADKRPIAEIQLPYMARHPQTGGYFAASGLMPVAAGMAQWCKTNACQFGVMLGDNIYPAGADGSATGLDSVRWQSLFKTPFQPLGELADDFQIYSVLGNHDWYSSRKGALAQLNFLQQSPIFYADGVRYQVTPKRYGGDVEIFAVDTHVLLAGQQVEGFSIDANGVPVSDGLDSYDAWAKPAGDEGLMLEWLAAALAASKARWKIVIAHNPLWSSAGGKHGQGLRLRADLRPILCRYADLYLVGHEHTLELQEDSCRTVIQDPAVPPLLQVLSGAASKQRPLNSRFVAWMDEQYPEKTSLFAKGMIWGFAHISLGEDEGVVKMISVSDAPQAENRVEYSYRFPRRSQW
jgi:tartrate-resistant acid phosphatase type 5